MENPASLLLVMMVVVFLVLALLILIVWLVGRIFVGLDKRKADAAKAAQAKPADAPKPLNTADVKASLARGTAAPAAPAAPPAVEQGITDETVAVIAASLAAYQSATGARGVIRSIRRAPENGAARIRTRSAWAQAAVVRGTTPFGG